MSDTSDAIPTRHIMSKVNKIIFEYEHQSEFTYTLLQILTCKNMNTHYKMLKKKRKNYIVFYCIP